MYTPSNDSISADEFIKREYRIWGEDYVDDLIDRGYTPFFTQGKWTWLVEVSSDNYAKVANARSHW